MSPLEIKIRSEKARTACESCFANFYGIQRCPTGRYLALFAQSDTALTCSLDLRMFAFDAILCKMLVEKKLEQARVRLWRTGGLEIVEA